MYRSSNPTRMINPYPVTNDLSVSVAGATTSAAEFNEDSIEWGVWGDWYRPIY